MNAFLFPGQSSQEVGMGKELYDGFLAVRKILDKNQNEPYKPDHEANFLI